MCVYIWIYMAIYVYIYGEISGDNNRTHNMSACFHYLAPTTKAASFILVPTSVTHCLYIYIQGHTLTEVLRVLNSVYYTFSQDTSDTTTSPLFINICVCIHIFNTYSTNTLHPPYRQISLVPLTATPETHFTRPTNTHHLSHKHITQTTSTLHPSHKHTSKHTSVLETHITRPRNALLPSH